MTLMNNLYPNLISAEDENNIVIQLIYFPIYTCIQNKSTLHKKYIIYVYILYGTTVLDTCTPQPNNSSFFGGEGAETSAQLRRMPHCNPPPTWPIVQYSISSWAESSRLATPSEQECGARSLRGMTSQPSSPTMGFCKKLGLLGRHYQKACRDCQTAQPTPASMEKH